jgi:MoaA/NifB/PqqE/SkfB family radical SAM enzyme
MFLNPFYKMYRPTSFHWLKHSRNVRPIIKIGKEKFQLSIDVKDYDKEELRVKARPEFVIIEGKQERKIKNGFIIRHFVRKYKLPHGCHPSNIKTNLSADGILTVSASRSICDINTPCETLVPITFTEAKEESLVSVQQPEQKNGKKT